MTMPFYVSPEQMMKDRADYARKGIARGRSLVAFSAREGIVLVAENPSRTLYKISEIYDRIAFAGVGKYNEFEMLRIAGVRQADVKGYSFSREDVNARALANAYAQTLGQIFTHEMKPYEVEILVAQVAPDQEDDELFHVLYDGIFMDEHGFAVLGGQAEQIAEALEGRYEATLSVAEAVQLGAQVLSGADQPPLGAAQLEVAVLDRRRARRAFHRITGAELEGMLGDGADAAAPGPAEEPEAPEEA
jgi:proteasome alpha subunit